MLHVTIKLVALIRQVIHLIRKLVQLESERIHLIVSGREMVNKAAG
jgi:hypothetical protein